MKKFIYLIANVLLLCAFMCGCGGKNTILKESDNFIVLTPSEEYEGKTLSQFMDNLKKGGELDYKVENNMVTSVNGIDNAADYSYCWMLYTDDAENSNKAWGTIEYKDKTYASASYGATQLIVKKDCVYIWVYTKFQ